MSLKPLIAGMTQTGGAGGGGGATIPNTTNVLEGDGAGNAADSGIDPADVVMQQLVYLNNTVPYAAVDGDVIGSLSANTVINLPLPNTGDYIVVYDADGGGNFTINTDGGGGPFISFGGNIGTTLVKTQNNQRVDLRYVGGGWDVQSSSIQETKSPNNNTQLPATTAYADAGDATVAAASATAAQGAKADTALQPATVQTLPDGTTATTQTPGDNSNKASTTAYTDAGLSGKLSTDGSLGNTTGSNDTIAGLIADVVATIPIASSFSGVGTATTTFTVTFGGTMPASYKVTATPSNVLSAAIFYVNNKTTTTFDVVYLTGLTGTVAFDWAVFP